MAALTAAIAEAAEGGKRGLSAVASLSCYRRGKRGVWLRGSLECLQGEVLRVWA